MDIDLKLLEDLGERMDALAKAVAGLKAGQISPADEAAAVEAQANADKTLDTSDAAAAYLRGQADQLAADQAAVGNIAGVLGDRLGVVEAALGNATGGAPGNATADPAAGAVTGEAAAGALTIGPSTLPDGTVGVAYSEQLEAQGATGTPEFSAGALPPGLGLTTDGLLSGIPAAAGDTSFEVQVNDGAGAHGNVTYALNVAPGAAADDAGGTTAGNVTGTQAPPPLLIEDAFTEAEAVAGQPYQGSVHVVGGTPPYTVSFDGLPEGLTGDGSGSVTGTPAAAGDADVVVTVTDAAGASVVETIALDVAAPAA